MPLGVAQWVKVSFIKRRIVLYLNIEAGENMSNLLIVFLLFLAFVMAIVVLLIIVLSAALLIFAGEDKKVQPKVKPLMEPEKSTN